MTRKIEQGLSNIVYILIIACSVVSFMTFLNYRNIAKSVLATRHDAITKSSQIDYEYDEIEPEEA